MGSYRTCKRGAKGSKGSSGNSIASSVPTAFAGKDGEINIQSLSSLGPIVDSIPSAWAGNYIHQIELDLLNKNTKLCGEKIAWLDFIETNLPEENNADLKKHIKASIYSISNNALSGLDPFGIDISYVPLVKYHYLYELLSNQLDLATKIEEATRDVTNAKSSQNQIRAFVNKTIRLTKDQIRNQKVKIITDFGKTNELQDQILDLLTQLNSLWEQLRDADVEFRAAAQRQAKGCGFDEILQFGVMVASIYATGGAAVAFVSSAGSALNKVNEYEAPDLKSDDSWYKSISDKAKTYSKILKPAGNKLSEFQESYNESKKLWKEFREEDGHEIPGALGSDYVKLLVDKDKFDKEIEKFLNLKEAVEYKRLMDLFVNTADIRNHKIIEHDTIVRGIWSGWADILGWRNEIGDIVGTKSYDYSLTYAKSYMDKSLAQIKWQITKHLVLLSRALTYSSGNLINLDFYDRTVGSLSATASSINASHLDILVGQGTGGTDAQGISVPLKDVLTQEAQQNLIKGETVVFNIPINHKRFRLRYGITCNRIKLSNIEGDIIALLEHQGLSIMKIKDGSVKTFSHQVVRLIYEKDQDGKVISKGDLINNKNQNLIGPSPFGPWKMVVKGSKETLAKLLNANFEFDITSRPIDI